MHTSVVCALSLSICQHTHRGCETTRTPICCVSMLSVLLTERPSPPLLPSPLSEKENMPTVKLNCGEQDSEK